MTGCESVEVWEKHNYEHTNEFYDDEKFRFTLIYYINSFSLCFLFFFLASYRKSTNLLSFVFLNIWLCSCL